MTLLRTARAAVVAAVAVLAMSCAPAGAAPAFPGAVGYGAGADGWRGGQVIAVTTLDDAGPGSLRECAEAVTPRVCVFRVAGTITLNSRLNIRSAVYVAGQTAPGDGIQLKLSGTATHSPVLIKGAQDVVLRFLKIRPGTGPMPQNIDAVTVENSQRVYLGNLSLMFAADETVNVHVSNSTVRDITLADSIVAWGLDNAGHPNGNHSKGALICSYDGTGNECGRISLIGNLLAHNRDRNPDLKGTAVGPVEVINNVFYNPISQFGEFYNFAGDLSVSYRGNVAIKGPSSGAGADAAVDAFMDTSGHALRITAKNNLAYKDCPPATPLPILGAEAKLHVVGDVPSTLKAAPASDTVALVTARVGDRLPDGTHRDSLDQRVLDDLANCTGAVISNPSAVGGWPTIAAAAPPADSDGDLLPDDFETARGLDPAAATDPWTLVGGVPAVEAWLAGLAGDL